MDDFKSFTMNKDNDKAILSFNDGKEYELTADNMLAIINFYKDFEIESEIKLLKRKLEYFAKTHTIYPNEEVKKAFIKLTDSPEVVEVYSKYDYCFKDVEFKSKEVAEAAIEKYKLEFSHLLEGIK